MADHDGTKIVLVRFSEEKLRRKVHILVDNWQFTLSHLVIKSIGP